VNTGLDTPHVFPVRVLYFVSRPTWRVALCSARKGASLAAITRLGDAQIISRNVDVWNGLGTGWGRHWQRERLKPYVGACPSRMLQSRSFMTALSATGRLPQSITRCLGTPSNY
jgi:hypothetical protein